MPAVIWGNRAWQGGVPTYSNHLMEVRLTVLLYLNLQNFALIDNLSLDFFPGFNVLTGETGAGKSIIIGALGLILGERASADQVRTGFEQAYLEAVFSPPVGYPAFEKMMVENGLPLGEEIIISREISLGGRNLCRINGRAVPLNTLKNLGSFLVDMHGQHSHQSLLRTEQHLTLLDEFGSSKHAQQIALYQGVFARWKKARQKLLSLGKNTAERANQLELLSYQYEEITHASLNEKEEINLMQQLAIQDNLEKILLIVDRAYTEVYAGGNVDASITDRLNMLIDEFTSLQKVDPRLGDYVNLLSESVANLTEFGRDLYDYQGTLSYSPEERKEIENRLEVYYRLKRKHQATVGEILVFAEDCREQIEVLKAGEQEALFLEKECGRLALEAADAAGRLSELRKTTAGKLKAGVEDVLGDLGIKNGIFSVSFKPREKLLPSGAEDIEFLFSANPGEDPKPLAKIISAGEMARVMLALKSILAEQDRISTLVFDEIDSGIGGKTIQQVAQKMAELSRRHQIICVTHSPHLAGRADHQYHLFKEVREGRSSTRARHLEGEERLLEIARMLDGSGSEITKKHAAELLKGKTSLFP